MNLIAPAKWLLEFNKGNVTRMELHYRLIQAAAACSVMEIVPFVPVDELQAIRDLAAVPPASLVECPRIFAMGSWDGPHDADAEEHEYRRLWYEGIWQWHNYF